MKERTYICCDLKSFYASVECVERGLDPMTTNLVVADQRRTEKTICLAVSPSLKVPVGPGCSRWWSGCGRSIPSGRGKPLAGNSPAPPGMTQKCGKTHPWPWTI